MLFVEELFYKDEGLNWRREFKELSGIVFTYTFHFHISSELFYPVTELISVVVCDSVEFQVWSYFSNGIIYRVSLLGYGNMSGETMIFTVEGASQRKCLPFTMRLNLTFLKHLMF